MAVFPTQPQFTEIIHVRNYYQLLVIPLTVNILHEFRSTLVTCSHNADGDKASHQGLH